MTNSSMRRFIVIILFTAFTVFRGNGEIRNISDVKRSSLEEIGKEVQRLSKSKNTDNRLLAGDIISMYPAFLSRETAIDVVNRLASDENPSVRDTALLAIIGLIDVALVEPFLPLVKKMQRD